METGTPADGAPNTVLLSSSVHIRNPDFQDRPTRCSRTKLRETQRLFLQIKISIIKQRAQNQQLIAGFSNFFQNCSSRSRVKTLLIPETISFATTPTSFITDVPATVSTPAAATVSHFPAEPTITKTRRPSETQQLCDGPVQPSTTSPGSTYSG